VDDSFFMEEFSTDELIAMEKYFRSLIADQIDDSLYRQNQEERRPENETYWFNNGMRLASIIARYGYS